MKKSTNLTRQQENICKIIRGEKKLMIIPSDKNLGPCIIEILEYVKLAYDQHLSDRGTYRRLANEQEAITIIYNA